PPYPPPASAPAATSCTRPGTKSAPAGTASRCPVDRSSSTVTRCPAASSWAATTDPMYPAPPVTSSLIGRLAGRAPTPFTTTPGRRLDRRRTLTGNNRPRNPATGLVAYRHDAQPDGARTRALVCSRVPSALATGDGPHTTRPRLRSGESVARSSGVDELSRAELAKEFRHDYSDSRTGVV